MAIFDKLLPKKRVKKFTGWIPSYLKRSPSGGSSDISNNSINRINQDLTDLRYGSDQKSVVRDLSKVNPDLSHALNTLKRFIITDSYTIFARDVSTNTIDVLGTEAAQVVANRLNKLPPTPDTYYKSTSFNGTSETLLHQVFCNGDMMAELVLDNAYLPARIQAISTNDLKYEQKGKKEVPYIEQEGIRVFLDSPLVKSVTLNQDPDTPYSDSFFESAIQAIVASEEYRNDIRRAFRKASLPRVAAKIDQEKFLASLTNDVLYDSDKRNTAMSSLLSAIEDQLNGLNPEDALVFFDSVDVTHLSQGNTSTHDSLSTHSQIMNGLISTGLKTLPSILGRGESQSTASTEAVLMLKMVENIQDRLNELYSGLLTMAVRLLGHDVTIEFQYEKPNLRPDIELESFKAMRQSRILEQLSLGLLSDVEASILLTGNLPGPDFESLSGTRFKSGSTEIANPYSNTSVTGEGVNNTKDQKDRNQGDSQPKTNGTTG